MASKPQRKSEAETFGQDHDWICVGCGILSPDRKRSCECATDVVRRTKNGEDIPGLKRPDMSKIIDNGKDEIPDELLPCPVCDGEAELLNLVDDDDYFVQCTDCEVQQIANYKLNVAVRRWNTRT